MAKVTGGAPGGGFSFPKGGSGKMFGQQSAGKQKPGVTSHEVNGGDAKFPSGGGGRMFGKGHANAAEAGSTAKKSQ